MLRILAVLLCSLLPSTLCAEKRLALIIGNDAYENVTPLQKAVADAKAIAEQLIAVGFETTLATDVSRRDFNLAVARFTSELETGDTAFVFFAGHGVEIEGENYLLPTDIVAPKDLDSDFVISESIALSQLLDRIRRTGARTTLAILDACRDNPFPRTGGRSIGRTRGLGRIAAPEGTFVMFSAGAGQQALDVLNPQDSADNSVFTRLLLPKLAEPGLELRTLMADLRVEVRDLARSEGHLQFPAYYDELLGEFYFSQAAADRSDLPEAVQPSDVDLRADFALAQDIGTVYALQAFIDQYEASDDFAVTLAKRMLADLQGDTSAEQQPATASAAVTEPDVPEGQAPDAPVTMTRRDLIRESQKELNRLGCDAGRADGIVGARTRAAFDRFRTDTGADLAAAGLGTAPVLSALQAARAPACTPRPVVAPQATTTTTRSAPRYTLTGTWSWRAKCPLFVEVTGTVTYKSTGAGTFRGDIVDMNGVRAVATTRLSGRDYSARVVGLFTTSETGRLSSSGNSFTASNSIGCTITARRN